MEKHAACSSETEYSYELLFPEIIQKKVQNWYLGVLLYVAGGQNIPRYVLISFTVAYTS